MKKHLNSKAKVVLALTVVLAVALALTGGFGPQKVVQTILTPLRAGATGLTRQAQKLYSYIFRYEALETENQELRARIAELEDDARTADSLEDFYARAKTKRYPHARLRRLALAAFLGLRAAERPPAAPYVRVLGLSGRGRELLRRMKETCALPVVVKPAQARALDGDARALFEAEARRTDLFGLCFPTARPCGLEWTRSPVVKERQG